MKKLLTIFLTLAVSLCALTACSGDEKKPAESKPSASENVSSATSKYDSVSAVEGPDKHTITLTNTLGNRTHNFD